MDTTFYSWSFKLRNRGGCLSNHCVTLPHMSIRARVVIAVALKQVDHAPYAQASAQRDYKYLQSVDCRCKKCHMFLLGPNFKVPFYRCFVLPQAPIKKTAVQTKYNGQNGYEIQPLSFLILVLFYGFGRSLRESSVTWWVRVSCTSLLHHFLSFPHLTAT